MRKIHLARRQQPQEHLAKSTDGLGRDLVFAGDLGRGAFLEVGSDRPFLLVGAPTQQITTAGLATSLSGSVGQYLYLEDSVLGNIASGSQYTVAFVAIPDDASTRGTIFSLGHSVDTDPYIWLEVNQTAGRLSFNTRGDAGAGAISTTTNSFAAGQQIVGVGVCYSDTSFKAILNGDLSGAASGAGTSTGYTLNRTAIGVLLRSTAIVPYLGKVLLVAAWNRALLDEEIIEFSANPWQIFTPQTVYRRASGIIPRSAVSSIDAAIQFARTAVSDITAAIQAQRSSQASIDAALSASMSAQASVEAAISHGRSASGSIESAVVADRQQIASISAQIEGAVAVSAGLNTAVQVGRIAQASIQAAIQASGVSSASIEALIAQRLELQASLGAALLSTRTVSTGVSAYIQIPGAVDELYPLAGLLQGYPLAGQTQTFPLT